MASSYRITADHTNPAYRVDLTIGLDSFANQAFRILSHTSSNPAYGTTYTVTARAFGGGRPFSTPEAAVQDILASQGCTNIQVSEVEAA